MRIFIDIGHPAHVHYFRNFIRIMQDKGHQFFISARDKEITHRLLDHYNLPYKTRGKGKKGMWGKFVYIVQADFLLVKWAIRFKPDLFISFASPYAAHVAWLMKKPHFVFDDTEHASLNHMLYKPFSKEVITPAFFQKDMGSKHIRFNSLMELCYLHPRYFEHDHAFIREYGIKNNNEKLALIRVVSWDANHDVGLSGLSVEELKKLVEQLKPHYKILISAEGKLPEQFASYKINIPPEKIHDLLYSTDLFITEGATMATEAALLGTPVIYVNSLNAGTLKVLEQYGLIINLRNSDHLISYIQKLIADPQIKEKWGSLSRELIKKLCDPTEFLVDHITKYELYKKQ